MTNGTPLIVVDMGDALRKDVAVFQQVPRRALTHWVRCRTRRSRSNTMAFACCSSVLTGEGQAARRWHHRRCS